MSFLKWKLQNRFGGVEFLSYSSPVFSCTIMGTMFPSPCRQTGCTSKQRETYCEEHEPNYESKSRDEYKRREIYSTKKWKRKRKEILKRDPFCSEDSCNRPSTQVDHIIPIRDGGDKWNNENLQGLCKKCHSRKTAREVDGF